MSAISAPPERLPDLGSGAMFDNIAARYDAVNRVLSLGLDRGWRRRTARELELEPGHAVLDLATGTGELALELLRVQPGLSLVGLDPSREMLRLAAQKFGRAGIPSQRESRAEQSRVAQSDRPGRGVELCLGQAEQLPFAAASFDRVTMAFGIRNVPDRMRALHEIARVLKPNGRVAILEFSEPRGGVLSALARIHVRTVVPWLGAVLSGAREYRHLERSIAAFPAPEEFSDWLAQAGLQTLRIVRLCFGAVFLTIAAPAHITREG